MVVCCVEGCMRIFTWLLLQMADICSAGLLCPNAFSGMPFLQHDCWQGPGSTAQAPTRVCVYMYVHMCTMALPMACVYVYIRSGRARTYCLGVLFIYRLPGCAVCPSLALTDGSHRFHIFFPRTLPDSALSITTHAYMHTCIVASLNLLCKRSIYLVAIW